MGAYVDKKGVQFLVHLTLFPIITATGRIDIHFTNLFNTKEKLNKFCKDKTFNTSTVRIQHQV